MPLLGWCLTGHHPNCPETVETWGDRDVHCSCLCHEDREPALDVDGYPL